MNTILRSNKVFRTQFRKVPNGTVMYTSPDGSGPIIKTGDRTRLRPGLPPTSDALPPLELGDISQAVVPVPAIPMGGQDLVAPVLSLLDVSDDTVSLDWSYSGDSPTGFTLYYSTTSGGPYDQTLEISNGATRSVVVEGLSNATGYAFVLAANAGAGSNQVIGVTTGGDFANTAPSVMAVTQTTVLIAWQTPFGPPSDGKWFVEYGTSDGGPYPEQIVINDANAYTCLISGLTANTTYYFVVTGADQYATSGQATATTVIASNPGQANWAVEASATIFYGIGPVVDSLNKVIMSGGWKGTFKLGPDGYPMVAQGGGLDIPIGKLTSSGVYNYERGFGNTGDDRAYGMVVLSDNSVVLAGDFQGTVDFGDGHTETSSSPSWEMFVSKYSAAGVCQWSTRFGRNGKPTRFGYIAADPSDNIYFAGTFPATVPASVATFVGPSGPSFNLTSNGDFDIAICKMNSSGVVAWAKNIGSTALDQIISIAADTNGDVIITGAAGGPIPALGITAAGYFVAKFLGTNGNFVWARRLNATIHGATTDSANRVFVYGAATSVDFGDGSFRGPCFFVAAYTSANVYQWAYTQDNPDVSAIGYIHSVTRSGNKLAITGKSQSALNFGHGWMFGGGCFIAQFTLTGNNPPPVTADWAFYANDNASYGLGIAYDSASHVNIAGYFENPTTINFGNGITVTATGKDGFLVQYNV